MFKRMIAPDHVRSVVHETRIVVVIVYSPLVKAGKYWMKMRGRGR
jgi:hypothetical protein